MLLFRGKDIIFSMFLTWSHVRCAVRFLNVSKVMPCSLTFLLLVAPYPVGSGIFFPLDPGPYFPSQTIKTGYHLLKTATILGLL